MRRARAKARIRPSGSGRRRWSRSARTSSARAATACRWPKRWRARSIARAWRATAPAPRRSRPRGAKPRGSPLLLEPAEVHFGHRLLALGHLVVGRLLESQRAGVKVGREHLHHDVEVAHHVVVTLALRGEPVLGAGDLVHQPDERLVAPELGV